MSCSRCRMSSSPISSRWKTARSRSLSFLNISGLRQDGGDRAGNRVPALGLVLELLSAQGCKPVILGLAIVLRHAPLGIDPAFDLHFVKSRIQRTLFGV